jgi:hypothetical protein
MPDEPDIKIEMYPNLLVESNVTTSDKYYRQMQPYLSGRPLKDKNGMELWGLSGYKILEDSSDEDDMLPDLV